MFAGCILYLGLKWRKLRSLLLVCFVICLFYKGLWVFVCKSLILLEFLTFVI